MTTTEILRKRVKQYVDGADEQSLKMVQAIFEVQEKYDWWDDVSEGAKASIEQGLKDEKEGKLTPHKEVMKKYKKWL